MTAARSGGSQRAFCWRLAIRPVGPRAKSHQTSDLRSGTLQCRSRSQIWSPPPASGARGKPRDDGRVDPTPDLQAPESGDNLKHLKAVTTGTGATPGQRRAGATPDGQRRQRALLACGDCSIAYILFHRAALTLPRRINPHCHGAACPCHPCLIVFDRRDVAAAERQSRSSAQRGDGWRAHGPP